VDTEAESRIANLKNIEPLPSDGWVFASGQGADAASDTMEVLVLNPRSEVAQTILRNTAAAKGPNKELFRSEEDFFRALWTLQVRASDHAIDRLELARAVSPRL